MITSKTSLDESIHTHGAFRTIVLHLCCYKWVGSSNRSRRESLLVLSWLSCLLALRLQKLTRWLLDLVYCLNHLNRCWCRWILIDYSNSIWRWGQCSLGQI